MKPSRSRPVVWALPLAALIQSIAAVFAVAQTVSHTVPAYPDHAKLLVVRDSSGRELSVGRACDWEVRCDHILAHFQEAAGQLPAASAGFRSRCMLWTRPKNRASYDRRSPSRPSPAIVFPRGS